MTVETTAQYLNELNETLPRFDDLLKEGDDHIRLMKKVLKATFPYIDKALNVSADELNALAGIFEPSGDTLKFLANLTIGNGKTIDANNSPIKNVGAAQDPQDAVTVDYFKKELMKLVYPIGCVYTTTNQADPSVELGFGTWEPFAAGRLIVGAGTATDANQEARTFALGDTGGTYGAVAIGQDLFSKNIMRDTTTNGAKVDKMPPYIVVNIWKRTA